MNKRLIDRAKEGRLQDAEVLGILEDPYAPVELKKVVRDNYTIESDEDSIMYGDIFPEDRNYELSDGEFIEIAVVPSGLPAHHRVARRLEVKFKTSRKEAALAAYCLFIIGGLDREITKWFEGLASEQGWDEAFAYVRSLAAELRKEGGKDTDVMGRVEETLPDAVEFTYIPLNAEGAEWKLSKEAHAFEAWAKKIRTAGVNSIGSIGKTMYGQRLTGSFELYRELWNLYKARKQQLAGYRKV